MNIKLTGTVEIDEAVITGKRKYQRSRLPSRLYWIFGLYSRDQKMEYIFLVENRRSETLLTILLSKKIV